MGVGGVGVETLVSYFVETVYAVGEHLLLDAVEIVADDDCFEFYAEP